MKILIVTHGFYPDQTPRSFRATELAKEFFRQGHDVTVMAPGHPGRNEFAKANGITFLSLGELKWKMPNLPGNNALSKLFNRVGNRFLPLFFEYPMMELAFKVNNALKRVERKYDAVISVAVPYPIHWGVAWAWHPKKSEIANLWVADCGDPYCLQENDTFRPPFYFRFIEKWFMRKADYITVPTRKSILGYFPEFQSKIEIIPQGFKFSDVRRKKLIGDGIVRFGYGGSFIPGRRDPTEFIVYLSSLPEEYKYEFHVFTTTPQLVQSLIGNDKRIQLHEPIERNDLLELFSSFDFVINFANIGEAQTPSKLIDYSIIEKPILQIVTGNLNQKVFLEFMAGDYSNSLNIESIDDYRIENVADKFLKLINDQGEIL